MSEALETSSEEAKEWLQNETSSILTPVHEKAETLLGQMRDMFENLKDVCKVLLENSGKEIEKRNMKTYRRARALNKLGRMFSERIQQIEVPNKVSYDGFRDFVQATQKTFVVIEVDVKNWFPRISPFFIMDRRKFLGVFEKAKDSLKDLENFLTNDYVKTKTFEETDGLIDTLLTLEERMSTLEARKNRNQARTASIDRKIADIAQEISDLKNAGSLTQISDVNAEIGKLQRELKHKLRHLRKPFIKLQSHVFRKGGLAPEELEKLGYYIESPFEALSTEEDQYPILKQILKKLTSLMSEGKIKLKRDRRRKAKEAIDTILKNGSFNKVYQRCREAAVERRRLSTLTETKKIRGDLSRLQEELKKLKRRRKVAESKEVSVGESFEEIKERVHHQKAEIEKNILDLLGKRVVLEVKV